MSNFKRLFLVEQKVAKSAIFVGYENSKKIIRACIEFLKGDQSLILCDNNAVYMLAGRDLILPIMIYSLQPIQSCEKLLERMNMENVIRYKHEIKYGKVPIIKFKWLNGHLLQNLPTVIKGGIKVVAPLYNLIYIYESLSNVRESDKWYKYIEYERMMKLMSDSDRFTKLIYYPIADEVYHKLMNIIKGNKDVILTGYQAMAFLIKKYKLKTNFKIVKGKLEFITMNPETLIRKIESVNGNIEVKMDNSFWNEYRVVNYMIHHNNVNICNIYVPNGPRSYNLVDDIQVADTYGIIANMLMQAAITPNNKHLESQIVNFLQRRYGYLMKRNLSGIEEGGGGLAVMQNNYLEGSYC